MKTSIVLGLGLLLSTAAFATGCAQGASAEDSTTSSDTAALTSAIAANVLHAEPNAQLSDYHMKAQTFRLFGTQPNAEGGGTATIADKSNWATRTITAGDWLARNLQVVAVHSSSIDLRTASGTVTVARGKDFSQSALYHRFDTVAKYEGKNAWTVDGATMADLHKTYGAGVKAEDRSHEAPAEANLGETASSVAFTAVDARGVLAHVGINPNMVLLAMNGVQVHAGDMDKVATALTKSGTQVTLTVSEHGARHSEIINVD